MLRFVCPLIVVDEIGASRHFYEQLLGQQVKADYGENVAFEGDFAIHLKTHYQALLGDAAQYPVTRKAHNGELYFESDEIEAIQQRLLQAGTEFVHPIREEPWGQCVMRLYDPDGHIVEIGEPMETAVLRLHSQGLTAADISERTLMPGEFVQRVIEGRVETNVEEKLHAMGLALPDSLPPIGNYLGTVKTGDLLFISGHGPRKGSEPMLTGKLGLDLTVDQGYAAARETMLNCLSTAKRELGNLDRVKRVVKLLGMVNCTAEFVEHPKVINGASDLLVALYGEAGRHARSAVGMQSLPMNIPVEIEAIFEIDE
jgi:enamine deaminase RidA (YjgF/YER057c/UK114 family)/uncharacterized glyoxalase superfamily protein PhnB